MLELQPSSFTFGELLDASAARTPDAPAVVSRDESLTFAALRALADDAARRLVHGGIRRGDRVGVLMRQSVRSAAALWAVAKAGGVFVIVDPRLTPAQVQYRIDHSEMAAIITDDALAARVPAQTRCQVVGAEALLQPLPDGAPERGAALPRLIGADLGAILYTSGSTGRPKGALLSQENLVMGARIVARYLGLTSADVLLAVLPFHFDYGLNQLTTAALVGATLAFPVSNHPNHICEAIEAHRVTGLAGVPPLWMQLLQPGSPFRAENLQSLRYVTNSGGAVPTPYVQKLQAALPHGRVFLMYGLTEAFRSTFLPPDEIARRPTSMGKAIPNVEILVVRPDGSPCDVGEIGELVHRGGVIFQGYWRDPEATHKVLRPAPQAEAGRPVTEMAVWSGDYVARDAEGFLFFHGRRDEQIKCAGYRMSPQEIEEIVHQMPRVREAVAFGVPDEELGAVVRVVAVLQADASFGEKEFLAECKRVMPPYMVPRSVVFVAELPRGLTGKIDRVKVKQELGGDR